MMKLLSEIFYPCFVEPEGKIVSVFVLQEDGRYGRQEVYSEEDQISLNIIPNLTIDLKLVFTGID